MGVQPIAPTPIPCVPRRPPTELQRFERELRRDRDSDVVTEWLNFAGVALFVTLAASVALLLWMVMAR